jgi:hypothetical protein
MTMESLRRKLFDTNQIQFEDFSASGPLWKGDGQDQWAGRYWLPASDRVEPTRKYSLIRVDGRVGEMLLDRFLLSDIREDFAAFQGDLHSA